MNPFELHPDRLSTTDETGKRIFLFPADVRGFFRSWRTRVQFVLILFFLGLPWVRVDGEQAVLLDITNRKFEFFGLSLRAHNAPLLLFVLAVAGFGLFFATAIWGRVWCGWACPQTVFIDGVFRRIERWIEGSALERRQLASAPWSARKILKRSLKWSAFLSASLVITHSFLAYFVGTENLARMIKSSPVENWGSFLFMAVSTSIILFDFAWFREQFCTIVCPYGRFQSVLMDSRSKIVAYNLSRGEPRATPQAKAISKTHGTKLGDCVNCYRCVQVCPTGIDIRRGVQMECIACTACIDACDEVMAKLKKPTGLIRYDSLAGLQGKTKTRFRLRPVVYLSVVAISALALILSLAWMKPVDVAVLRAKESPYTLQTTEAGEVFVLNHFKIELSNQSGALHQIIFELHPEESSLGVSLVTALKPFPLKDGDLTRADVFARFPKNVLSNGQRKVRLKVQDQNTQTGQIILIEKEMTLVGPFT